MGFSFNGNTPKEIYYNTHEVKKLIYNNNVVWKKRLPSGYKEVEYIESSNGAYLLINYNLKGHTELDMKLNYTDEQSTGCAILGNSKAGTGSVSNPKYNITSSSSTSSLGYYYYSGSYAAFSPTFSLLTHDEFVLKTRVENDKLNIYVNDTVNTRNINLAEFTCSEKTTIFGIPRTYKKPKSLLL